MKFVARCRRRLFAAAAALALIAAAGSHAQAQGVDRVRRQSGLDTGKITNITPLDVTISKGGVESNIPAEHILSIYLAGEPVQLATARNALQAGRPAEAVKALEQIPADGNRRQEIVAEIDFYSALAQSQLALAGQGDVEQALRGMRGFMSTHDKSFHIPEAVERIGDLLAAAGKHAEARTEYAKLAGARSEYYKLRSAWLVGRMWQAEGDHGKA